MGRELTEQPAVFHDTFEYNGTAYAEGRRFDFPD